MKFHSDLFSIRPVTQDDLPAILNVYKECEDFLALGPVSTASMEMVLKDLEISHAAGGIFCGIFTKDNKMVGVLDYVPNHYEGDPHAAFLELLMISASSRKLGIGKAAVEAFENEIMKDLKVTTILSGVQVNNPEAINFWQRNGYRIVSGPIFHSDLTTAFDLRKDLTRKEKEPAQ